MDLESHALFLRMLRRQKRRYANRIYAWTGMSNHHHIFQEAPTVWHEETHFAREQKRLNKPIPVGHMLCDTMAAFCRNLNLQKKKEGATVKDRCKLVRVFGDRHALVLLIYIFLNPVRSGQVSHPKDYPHTNFLQYSESKFQFDYLFDFHPSYLRLGDSPAQRQARFNYLINEAMKGWGACKWPGASASHCIGRNKGREAIDDFCKVTQDWCDQFSWLTEETFAAPEKPTNFYP